MSQAEQRARSFLDLHADPDSLASAMSTTATLAADVLALAERVRNTETSAHNWELQAEDETARADALAERVRVLEETLRLVGACRYIAKCDLCRYRIHAALNASPGGSSEDTPSNEEKGQSVG